MTEKMIEVIMRQLEKIISNFRIKTLIKDPAINTNCTEFEVNNWIISDFIIDKLVPVVATKPYPLSEQMLLVSTICRFKPTHIFEWGTNIGKSARIFYETTKYFKINSEIHSIDLPDDIEHNEHPHRKRGLLVKRINEINLHQGDGLDVSIDIINSLAYYRNPVFFLDGDHSYNSVFREISGILNNVNNPVILVHDTFYQSADSSYNIGPYNAIKSALNEVDPRLRVISMNIGTPGMTLLYHDENL